MIPKIFTAKEVDRQKILNTVLMGFSSDPLVRWMCPEAYNYVLFLEFFDGFGGAAIEHDSAYIVDGFRGTALWLPPGIEPDEEKVVKEIEKNTAIEKHEDLFKILEKLEDYHPDETCWYLPIIAVDPHHQNNGLGSFLMKHALDKIDEDSLPAYLESSNPKNMSLYERYGFETMGQIKIGDAPPIHPMIRAAR